MDKLIAFIICFLVMAMMIHAYYFECTKTEWRWTGKVMGNMCVEWSPRKQPTPADGEK